jgi:hypothetical protein
MYNNKGCMLLLVSKPRIQYVGGVHPLRSEVVHMLIYIDSASYYVKQVKPWCSVFIRELAWHWYDQAEFVSTEPSYNWC